LNTAPDYIQTSTIAFADWEVDRINIGQSGRIALGDVFSQAVTSQTYMNMLDHRINSFPVNYNYRFINASQGSLTLRIYENNNQVQAITFGSGAQQYVAGSARTGNFSFANPLPDNRSILKFEISAGSSAPTGYLDYFEINYRKQLRPTNNYLTFYSYDTTGVLEYQLNNFPSTNIKVFDVSDYANVRYVTNHTMLSGGECRFRFFENREFRTKYIAVGNDDFKSPSNPVKVDNSNLRGIADGARFIIITHKNFIEAASRLKSYRENEAIEHISTVVVDIQEIYNEFSCGILDVSAVRDFIKYAYDNWTTTPDYVLFFGGGTYDYKNLEGYNDNFIPTWQTTEHLALLQSFTTDDFFVKMDPGNDLRIDLAAGRITVKNPDEAHKIVDKIIDYEKNSEVGLWRNVITLVADDAYTSTSFENNLHSPQSENLSRNDIPDYFSVNKIYMATYEPVLTGSGKRMPDVNKAIINSINEGNLILNYIGHGNPELWAHEVVFDRNISIPQIKNQNKYFFLVAATCSFGYYDIPNFRSAAEELVLKENSGSIAALTASRLAYSSPNAAYTYNFYEDLLEAPRDSNGLPPTLGTANFETKQVVVNVDNVNTQKFFICGDPTLRLQIPRYQADIDTINGQAIVQTAVQISALGKVTLNGIIKKPDNSFWSDYNGEGIIDVMDSERIERYRYGERNFDTSSYVVEGGTIFRGRISVTNGKFKADFVVPKDISYENDRGKIVFYFYRPDDDGIGYTDRITVGGTDSTKNDGKGPEIEMYFDDPSYAGSFLINPDSKLIIRLSDETGINTTGTGVGHQLEGILNDDNANPIDFSNYFTGDLDAGGRSGEVNYSFTDLETGDHKLDVKAWDVFNNFSTEAAYFSVVSGDNLVIRDVYNYPNPFNSSTTFTFQQNLSSPLNVEIKVYTISGRLIKAITANNLNERFVTIDWDGRDNDGDFIANGTYLYKLIVKTTDGQYSNSILGKLAVIR